MYYEDYSLGHMETGVGNVDLSAPVDSDPKNLPPASPTILPHDDLEMMRNALQNLALVYSRNELAVVSNNISLCGLSTLTSRP